MRVLLVVNLAFEAGGAEKSVRIIRDGLRSRDHEALVTATDLRLDGQQSIADVVIPHIRGRGPQRLVHKAWYAAARDAVESAARNFSADIIHFHTIGELSPSALGAAAGIPKLMTVHGPEDFTSALMPWHLPAGSYRGSTYRREDLTVGGHARLLHLRAVQRPMYRRALRSVRRFVTPSSYMAQVLSHDVPRGAITVIPNGIDLPAHQAPSSSSDEILFVGRLEAVKGAATLLHAWQRVQAKCPDARLVLAGDGSYASEARRLASRLGIERSVNFVGWLPEGDVYQKMSRARGVVLPSIWPENYPTAAIEALAIGRPVIATRVGGMAELVQDGVNGQLVPPEDPRQLSHAIIKLLSTDDVVERSLAASRSVQHLSTGRFLDRLEREYEELVSKP